MVNSILSALQAHCGDELTRMDMKGPKMSGNITATEETYLDPISHSDTPESHSDSNPASLAHYPLLNLPLEKRGEGERRETGCASEEWRR